LREQTIMQHLAELRRRVLICVVALIVGSAVSFAFFERLIELLVRPARDLNLEDGGQLVYTEVTELLTTAVKVSFVAGLVVAMPIILYQVVMFVAPGLTGRERRYLFGFMPGAMLAFVSGVAFGYFVLTPPALHFLLSFGGDVAVPLIRVSNIINLMIRLLFWMGVAFETPLVMYLLAQLGIVSVRGLSRFRRYWVVVAFILGAIITPTFDPVNQGLVAIPLLVLYELGILLARFATRGRRKAEAAIMRS
jgi:sec-independent protein translocase protein TatC